MSDSKGSPTEKKTHSKTGKFD